MIKNIVFKVVTTLVLSAIVLVNATTVGAVNNPVLSSSCGLDIALVMDESTSINGGNFTLMQGAMTDFVEALESTPTEFALVDFGTNAVLQEGFTNNAQTIKDAIAEPRLGGTQYTNWEQGLSTAQALFPNRESKPDLIIFASDGNPNKYGNPATPAGNDQDEPIALAEAVTVADALKGSGVRIIPIAIGGDISVSNLEAISGSGNVIESDFASLASSLATLAVDLCGGTLTINKVVNDEVSLAGWEFTVDGNSYTTDQNGQTASIPLSNGSYDVIETTGPVDYTFVSAVCNGALNNGSPIQNGVSGVTMGTDNIISCTFTNQIDIASCTDENANNYGQSLPCTYDEVPQLCTDDSANNYGEPLPCTYNESGNTQCSDGIDNSDDEDDYTDAQDPGCHTDENPDNENSYNSTDDNESNSNGGGGGGGGSSKKKKSEPTGEVLGETAICAWDVNTYMRRGYRNDASQVSILQKDLLNGYMDAGLTVDGIFGPMTEEAVKAFQLAKKDKILIPWNLTVPTGIFYKTTLVEAKNTICPEEILPIPTDLIPWSANAIQALPAPAN